MDGYLHILAWVVGFAVLVVLAGWLGLKIGMKTARKYPAMAGMLLLFGSFVKLDPPPIYRTERIVRDEEDEGAGDPPTV